MKLFSIKVDKSVKSSHLKDADFLYPIYDYAGQFRFYINAVNRILLKDFNKKPIILIVRGSSGTTIAGALMQVNENIYKIHYIKKEEECSHNRTSPLSTIACDNNHVIIVDDFISTGKTILRCILDGLNLNGNNEYKISVITGGKSRLDDRYFRHELYSHDVLEKLSRVTILKHYHQ